ncbi:MAG: SagB/ThcOx family dehydrogenase [Desulfohalobiaceae bacterium]
MRYAAVLTTVLFLTAALVLSGGPVTGPNRAAAEEGVGLPDIETGEPGSLSDLLYKRRSVRRFGSGQIQLDEAARLLFAAQGITRKDRFRTVPSAGALYPLEIYLAAGEVAGLSPGVYRYRPQEHDLVRVQEGDKREAIARAAVGQMWISKAQAVLVVGAVFERTTSKYSNHGRQYVHMEAGCAAQSISLQAADLGLGTTVVGAFRGERIVRLIGAGDDVTPLLLMPVGRLP